VLEALADVSSQDEPVVRATPEARESFPILAKAEVEVADGVESHRPMLVDPLAPLKVFIMLAEETNHVHRP
jgi:hypothetical protein